MEAPQTMIFPLEEKDRLLKMYQAEIKKMQQLVVLIKNGNTAGYKSEPVGTSVFSEIRFKQECLTYIEMNNSRATTTGEIVKYLLEKYPHLGSNDASTRRKLTVKVSGALYQLFMIDQKIRRYKEESTRQYFYEHGELFTENRTIQKDPIKCNMMEVRRT